jgi:hypothetical protein
MLMPWPFENAVGDGDVLNAELAAFDFLAGLDGDVVIAGVEGAFGEGDVAAIAGVNAVGVRGVFGCEDGDAFDNEVFTIGRDEVEFGRVLQRDAGEFGFGAAVEREQIRAREREARNFLAGFFSFFPPDLAVAVNDTRTGEADAGQFLAADERDEIRAFGFGPVAGSFHEIVLIRASKQRRALVELHRRLRAEREGLAQISAGRELHRAADFAAGVEGLLNGGGVERFAVAGGTEFFDVEIFWRGRVGEERCGERESEAEQYFFHKRVGGDASTR